MKYSIVISTYNRCRQLLLTLTSLEQQTFPQALYEVLVVDDGSTDQTKELLKQYRPPYKLTYFSTGTRKGQATARNLGLKYSQGNYIIFCDADFLVTPDFIQIVDKYHLQHKHTVISGTPNSFQTIYTHFYPDFNKWEKEQARQTLLTAGFWQDSFLDSNQIIALITQHDIRQNFSKVQQVLGGQHVLTKRNKQELLKLDVAPWLLFITRCVSVQKIHLQRAGGFDERLVRGEDWELGFRLYKQGLSFMSMEETIGYHQEHPHAYRRSKQAILPFGKILLEKYGLDDPELLLLVNWSSSDELWAEIAVYKNSLRILKQIEKNPGEDQDALSSLLQASKIVFAQGGRIC